MYNKKSNLNNKKLTKNFKEFNLYIDHLYEILYKCKLNKDFINITLKKNNCDDLQETHNCYIKFVIYINKYNINKLYNFIRLHFSVEVFNNLINIFDLNKFLNNKSYGLITYICNTDKISNNSIGGFIMVYNNSFTIKIKKNDLEIFSTSDYFNKL